MSFPPSDVPLVFVDTETDGVHDGRRVWDLSIIRREPTGEIGEYQAFLPINLDTADPIGLAKGGFYDRHPLGRWIAGHDDRGTPPHVWEVANYRHPREVAVELARATHRAHWVGAVPGFDTEPLARLLRAYGLTPSWHYHLVDVEALGVGFLLGVAARAYDEARMAGRDVPAVDVARLGMPWRSDDLSRACGVEPPAEHERHTSMGDARWVMRWYDRMHAMAAGQIDPDRAAA